VVLKSIVKSTGATLTETTVTELKLDETLSDSLFAYKPPGDAQVFEDKATKFKKTD
jgi:outer membrane lipoprotein-sorting protein